MRHVEDRLVEFAQAAFHVRRAHAIAARQRALIERLERQGEDATSARLLLRQITGSLQIFQEDYARLKSELEDINWPQPGK